MESTLYFDPQAARPAAFCPECGGEHTWLLCGNETMIKEIEVPEEEPVP